VWAQKCLKNQRRYPDHSPPSQGILSASSGKRIAALPCSPAVCPFFKVSRAGQLLPLGSAPALSFSTTTRALLRRVSPGILSAPAHLPEVRPRSRAFFRTLPLILRAGISADPSDSSLPKVLCPHEGFPVHCVVLAVPGFPDRPVLLPDLAVLHSVNPRWLQTQPGMFTRPLAPCPLRDSCSVKVSPSVQPPPSRASCSPAFLQGCEAFLQTEIPRRYHG